MTRLEIKNQDKNSIIAVLKMIYVYLRIIVSNMNRKLGKVGHNYMTVSNMVSF